MTINFEHELKEIINHLEEVQGYLDCEKVIIANLRKHEEKGVSNGSIEAFMKQLVAYFEKSIESLKSSGNCVNYRYAAAFLNTLIATPYWRYWIRTINL